MRGYTRVAQKKKLLKLVTLMINTMVLFSTSNLTNHMYKETSIVQGLNVITRSVASIYAQTPGAYRKKELFPSLECY